MRQREGVISEAFITNVVRTSSAVVRVSYARRPQGTYEADAIIATLYSPSLESYFQPLHTKQ